MRMRFVVKLLAVGVVVAGAMSPVAAQQSAPQPAANASPAQTSGSDVSPPGVAGSVSQPDNPEPQPSATADTPPQAGGASSRQAAIEQEQAAKAKALHPYVPQRGEGIFQRLDTILQGGALRWHPFLESAYHGGGFTLGMGRAMYVSGYNYIDVRGSYSIRNYKRVEAEFLAPRIFRRRGELSVIGGWREATQAPFYGFGTNSSEDDRTNYGFRQPYGSALLTLFPARRILMLRGGAEFTRWEQRSGEGAVPSVDVRYTPASLSGLGADVTYLHTQGGIGLDWRTTRGYTRRGGFVDVALHDYKDQDDAFGFQLIEYEAIEHIPILREAWVLSFRGRVQTARDKGGQQTPFFMLPYLGGGHSLRGYLSQRFRDRNSLLLQAEWRIMVNRYLDTAFFYDAGKVTARTSDLDLDGLKSDYGFGLRFHTPLSTPLRVEIARSQERFRFIFTFSPAF